jgi:tight adherence protein B
MNPEMMPFVIVGVIAVFMLATLLTVGVVVVRPRMRLRRRMAALDLIGGGHASAAAGKDNNPRQKRIQDKLKELEGKGKKQARRNQIRSSLAQAGIALSIRNYLIAIIALGVACALGSMVLGMSVMAAVPIGVMASLALPKMILGFLAGGRQKAFTKEFANAVDVLIRGIRSGLPVGECLAIIGREMPEPVGQEFRLLVEGQKIGISIDELLRRGLERMPTSEYKFFAIVLQIQQSTGGNLADTLENLSKVLRARKKMKDKVQALSSEAKSSAAIIGSLPFGVMALIYFTNPEFLMPLFTTTVGHYLMIVAAVWMSIGVGVMMKMINFKI